MNRLRAFKRRHFDQVVALHTLHNNIEAPEEILFPRLHFALEILDALVAEVRRDEERHLATNRATESVRLPVSDDASVASLLAVVTVLPGVEEFGDGPAFRTLDAERSNETLSGS